jgi:hypothetical protein
MQTFDPSSRGFPLRREFDRIAFEKLLVQLFALDENLAQRLREELLGGGPPEITRECFEMLLNLSHTNGVFSEAAAIARSIGEVLFGRPLA